MLHKMGLMGATLGKIQLEMGHVGHRVGPRYGGCYGHTYANCPMETQNWNSVRGRFHYQFKARMGALCGTALQLDGHMPTVGVCCMTLRYTNMHTHVGCSSTDGIALRRYPELDPNGQADLCRVDWRYVAYVWYLESDPNDSHRYGLDLYRYALHLTVECACRCGHSPYASRM